MSKYLLSYDYHHERDYKKLYELLDRWGAKRILESLWFANLNGTATAGREALKSVADADDAFLVIELQEGSDWAHTRGVYKTGSEWLSANL